MSTCQTVNTRAVTDLSVFERLETLVWVRVRVRVCTRKRDTGKCMGEKQKERWVRKCRLINVGYMEQRRQKKKQNNETTACRDTKVRCTGRATESWAHIDVDHPRGHELATVANHRQRLIGRQSHVGRLLPRHIQLILEGWRVPSPHLKQNGRQSG